MPKPVMEIEILEDGMIKVTCPGPVPQVYHEAADQLEDLIEELSGGERTTEKLKDHHHHHHHGNKQHQRHA